VRKKGRPPEGGGGKQVGFDWHYTHHRIGWRDAGGPLRAAGVQEGLELVVLPQNLWVTDLPKMV